MLPSLLFVDVDIELERIIKTLVCGWKACELLPHHL